MTVVDAPDQAPGVSDGPEGSPLPPVTRFELVPARRTRTAPFVSVRDALADLAAGKAVMVVDDERRTNVGHLVLAAEKATADVVAFFVRYSSGLLRAALPEAECERLGLPLMAANNENPRGTAYTVSVDARTGISTGMSARDRAATLRLLAAPTTTAQDLSRPGNILPVCAQPGGVLRRGGHTEAAVDLVRLAGLRPVALLTEVVSEWDARFMAGRAELNAFCIHHGIKAVSIAALIAHRHRVEPQVERVVETVLPTLYGPFRAVGYRSLADGREHAAFVRGELEGAEDVLVRAHHECLIGDVFRSERCGCRAELDAALALVAERDRGVVLYLRGGDNLRRCLTPESAPATPTAILSADALALTSRVADAAAGTQIMLDLGVKSVLALGEGSGTGPDPDTDPDADPDTVQVAPAQGAPTA